MTLNSLWDIADLRLADGKLQAWEGSAKRINGENLDRGDYLVVPSRGAQLLDAAQAETSDLGFREKAHRWAPVARSMTDVELRVSMARESSEQASLL
jgi:hypothetical protein